MPFTAKSRAIPAHFFSRRAFIAIDCEAILLTLLALTLFFDEVQADRCNKGQGTPENKG